MFVRQLAYGGGVCKRRRAEDSVTLYGRSAAPVRTLTKTLHVVAAVCRAEQRERETQKKRETEVEERRERDADTYAKKNKMRKNWGREEERNHAVKEKGA